MLILELFFFIGLFIIFYSYMGYGILLFMIVKIRRLYRKQITALPERTLPEVTLIVAAYNEEYLIEKKIENSLALHYPKDKLTIIFITDGSSDSTTAKARKYKEIIVLHEDQRRGKVAAINRAMAFVKTPITVFSDANTLLNEESIYTIARHYADPLVGGVAGEKKILATEDGKIAAEGEGLYWQYESLLKRLDSELYTVVGAAGELFSIRTALYEHIKDDVLLDDFIISLQICRKGYRIVYEPGAYAMELPSASLKEEQKRKIRISAGAFQSMVMLKDLLNIFKYPLLSFQYISHRVLRWAVCPLLLPLLLLSNFILFIYYSNGIYSILLAAQLVFYLIAIAGWILSVKNIKVKWLYVPYYFLFINISLYKGFNRYLKGKQSVLWEKAVRQLDTTPTT